MAQKISFVSDLTGKDIPDDSEHASLVILSHPTLEDPRRIDAHVLEAASLKDESVDLVHVQVYLPGYDPESIWVPLAKFDKLFGKGIDSQAVLEAAEPFSESPVVRRRGRPAGVPNKATPSGRKNTASGRSTEELAAIRSWASSQGLDVAPRGRIKGDILASFDAAHRAS